MTIVTEVNTIWRIVLMRRVREGREGRDGWRDGGDGGLGVGVCCGAHTNNERQW